MFFNYTSAIPIKAKGAKEDGDGPKAQEPASVDTLEGADLNKLKSKAVVCPRCNSYIDL